ncbi:MAG TPA: hypothetical protein VJ692_07360 [Nitrospiraceae bacterium]|nr:hypothetical protein [Nitrospiraceae bacterium]
MSEADTDVMIARIRSLLAAQLQAVAILRTVENDAEASQQVRGAVSRAIKLLDDD